MRLLSEELGDAPVVSDRRARSRPEVMALVLAAVGIYGVMAYTVAQRTQEIGIRVALGATPGRGLSMVLLDGMSLVGLGLCLGIGAALVLTRVGASLLWGISSTDALTYVVIAAVLSAVALAAIVIPARRATRADPMQALRSEWGRTSEVDRLLPLRRGRTCGSSRVRRAVAVGSDRSTLVANAGPSIAIDRVGSCTSRSCCVRSSQTRPAVDSVESCRTAVR